MEPDYMILASREGRITCLGPVERGSLVVIHDPDGWDLELSAGDCRSIIANAIGHDQFCLMLVKTLADVAVVGPEGMREVLARMATEQLRLLAGGAQ